MDTTERTASGSGLSIVYLLTNPAMPGLVKIGRTAQDTAQARLDQLYTTGVPVPFELVFACGVEDAVRVEQALHIAFAPQRVNARREFFRIEPEQALAILRLLHIEDATQAVEEQSSSISEQELGATRALRARRPNLDFTVLGIPISAELRCTRNDAVVVVVGPRKVRFGTDELSLTAATREAMQLDYSVAPGLFWSYQGRTIHEFLEDAYGELSAE
ncbi:MULTISPECIES: GIY-YIG nuclease family protein [unclassified Methylobacterium]|uniref:GIY-YIG nuclease family protein n=1 Tax=unclassified Methylobacterium TaxID=2615210 RepID=UPI002269A3B3|nr:MULTISPECIES: GIY-YIG nuclease family protein [unclassified Methylobacterium]